MIEYYVDGSCRANGQEDAVGGIGIVGYKNGRKIVTYSKLVEGVQTNNEAEYYALGVAAKLASADEENPTIYSDSKLVVNQMSGEWQVKSETLQDLKDQIIQTLYETGLTFDLEWIPREKNKEADALAQSITEAE